MRFTSVLAQFVFGSGPGAAFSWNATDACCTALEGLGLTVLRNENASASASAYLARETSYFSVAAELYPKCIVQPQSAQEVSSALTTMRDMTCDLAVRGGGHMAWANASDIHDGVTLDLGLLNYTEYVADGTIAKIGSGSRWWDVYAALEPYNATAPGGRSASVGVGGYLVGGGNNFYSSEIGLGCDNVINHEVVLGSGEIINANATHNADLHKALKGGSSNFGIVTRYDMQAINKYEMWGGQVSWPLNLTEQHIEAYVQWVDNIPNYTPGSAVTFWSYAPSVGSIVIASAMQDTSNTAYAPAYDVFLDLQPQLSSTLRHDSHLNMAIELDEAAGYRQVWFTLTGANDARFIRRAVEAQAAFVEAWKADSPGNDSDFYNYITFQAMPTLLFEHSDERGGNVLGMDTATKANGSAILFQMQQMVKTAEQEAEARRRMIAMIEALKEYAVEQGIDFEWVYLGYADGAQNPLGSYGAENVQFMRDVAAKYDPDQVFQKRVPGGFKLSRVE